MIPKKSPHRVTITLTEAKMLMRESESNLEAMREIADSRVVKFKIEFLKKVKACSKALKRIEEAARLVARRPAASEVTQASRSQERHIKQSTRHTHLHKTYAKNGCHYQQTLNQWRAKVENTTVKMAPPAEIRSADAQYSEQGALLQSYLNHILDRIRVPTSTNTTQDRQSASCSEAVTSVQGSKKQTDSSYVIVTPKKIKSEHGQK